MLRISLAALVLTSSLLVAQSSSVYDFDSLAGSDTHPFTQLDQQDGWSEQTVNARNPCGVTATLSHDGTQSLQFQEVGPGYGCDASRINDTNWGFPRFGGTETGAYFQTDILVGYWGGSFGLAHDANVNGQIRGSETGERGVWFTIGTQSNVQLRLVAADGTYVLAPLAGLGITGGHWVRVRVAMDLAANGNAGLGYVDVQDLTAGATTPTAVPGLQGVPLALNPAATDASNPALWDAVWLHFEGATYGLDNIEVGSGAARAEEYGTGCGTPALELHGAGRPVVGTTASAETASIPAGSPTGFVLIGITAIEPGLDLTPIGMTGCLLQVVSDGALQFTPSGAAALHTFGIPNDPALVGGSVHLQSIAVALGVNPLGLIASNGLRWVIGAR